MRQNLGPRDGRNANVFTTGENVFVIFICLSIIIRIEIMQLHDKRLSSFVEVDNFLSATHSMDDVLAELDKHLQR